ncbi:MAG: hypothetical protein JSR41_08465 [Proteobacteria bacterium]|nr:hypothetical protein [Pseudomonadota bacterium]
MDRTVELAEIYARSGLADVIAAKPGPLRYDSKQDFSKLMFVEKSPFRLSSIELWDPKRLPTYFRIHYHADAPPWFVATLAGWSGFRNANSTGSNFLGDALTHAGALAQLLISRGRV